MNKNSKNHIWQAQEYRYSSGVQHEAALALLKCLKIKGDENILDVGCGDGKITKCLAECVCQTVIGTDISKEMIEYASKNCLAPNLKFVVGDAANFHFSEKFDIIFSSFAIQWLPKPEYFFKCAYENLKLHGFLAVTVPLGISSELEAASAITTSSEKWKEYFQNFCPGWHFQNREIYHQLLISNNLKPTHFELMNQTVIFPNRKIFEKYVIQWFTYLNALPENLRSFFFNEIIDKYLELNPMHANGEIGFSFFRLDFIAS